MSSYPVLEDIYNHRRTAAIGGFNQLRFVELYGASFVPLQPYEPDPNTSHEDYYYNTRQNILYRRLNTEDKAVWRRISE